MIDRYHTAANLPPVKFNVGPVQVTKISVGPMDNNAYLLTAGDGPVLLIDAAAEPERLLAALGVRELGAVVTTHQHADHVQGLAQVVAATGAEVWAGRPDLAAIARQAGVPVQPLWTGDRVDCGQITLAVIGLVGHTPGSIALVLTDGSATHIFSGDSLFPGGIGKTGSPAEFTSLLDDVTAQLFDRFDDETVVHPGHGDATTLGAERPHLAEWRARGW